ncbi:MAG TPA: alpha/beta hydrolase, partial [Myxococcota bacterium]|nr:alpha/beta hydrolase [Myxococcota bacterium]
MKQLSLALLACTACMRLDSFLYVPTRAEPGADLLARATDVPRTLREEVATDIVAADDTVVNAYILKHTPGDGTPASRHGQAVLYCHGNSKNIDHFALRVQALWRQGYTVLIFDYRGYGKTPGKPTEAGTYEDG